MNKIFKEDSYDPYDLYAARCNQECGEALLKESLSKMRKKSKLTKRIMSFLKNFYMSCRFR